MQNTVPVHGALDVYDNVLLQLIYVVSPTQAKK